MPNSRNETPDPSWVLHEPVRITMISSEAPEMFLVERLALRESHEHNNYASVAVVLSFPDDNMHVNGQYLDVGDDFMRYVSILDEVTDIPGYPSPGTSWTSYYTEE
jgi:hypothetical protein